MPVSSSMKLCSKINNSNENQKLYAFTLNYKNINETFILENLLS